MESGAKIQVAKKEVAETGMRNVFIEGPPSKYEKAKQLIEEIVDQHKSIHVVSPNSIIDYYVIPNNFTGLIIGLDFNARKRGWYAEELDDKDGVPNLHTQNWWW